MNWRTVGVIFRNEMRMLMRDRRTIFVAVLLPLIIYPVIIYGSRTMNERRERRLAARTYRYSITGSQAETVRGLIASGAAALAQQRQSARLDSAAQPDFKLREDRIPDPAAGLSSADIDFYLEGLSGSEADAIPKEKAGTAPGPDEPAEPKVPAPARLAGVPLIRIYFQGDRDDSEAGSSRMRDLLALARGTGRNTTLRQHGLQASPERVLALEEVNVARAGQVTGSYVGRFLTVLLLIFLMSSGSIVAMDSIAGEKERGSLETLLTTAANRMEIVAAKQLSIVAVALAITFIQIGNLFAYVTFKLITLPKDWVIEAPPATVVTLFLLFVPVAAFVASVLLMLSAYAKTYKEAQLYFFPVYLLSWVPALAGVLPGIRLRSAIVLVPVANVSVAVREIMVGKFDWPMIAAVFFVMAAAAVWAVRASARMLAKESLVTAAEADAADLAGGPALFPRHVLRWYGIMAVVLFAVALNVPQLATFRAQVLFNELCIFLGAPLLIAWKYRLNLREAWALRPVKPLAWVGVLLAVPSGLVVATGVFRLANLVIPVPEKVLEQFSREILPKDVPLWQLVLFISFLPAVCEEIAFRGTLLYGLRRKLRPAALALTVGLIFGLFHVALFRIVPTAFLGVILSAVALMTGSIFPGMVLHAANNGLGLWLAESGHNLGNIRWPGYLAGAAVFALAFLILYRSRTPYPGLRR